MIAERIIGRKLYNDKVVHHIDENEDNESR